ncbi:butyrophilin subfamily 3 member A2-like isoform X4 [Macrotis lagotis]|uniref:butyrophilin subfamily 3 member A2-like isoform X4 n=1 Tax=Macrotis lagotis TaxID=92651 RepID=UPI003D69A74D
MMPLSPRQVALLVLSQLPWFLSGEFKVIGPQQPIIASVGGEATFPCHLSPQLDAQHMEIVWLHGRFSRLVHRYKYGMDYLIGQSQEYEGRTKFLRNNIYSGSVALRLHHICPSDEGKYRCFFDSFTAYEEAEFEVYVADIGSVPHISIKGEGNKRFRLVCTSNGWYPKPQVQWKENQKKSLPSSTMIKKKENGLFSVETSIIISTDSKMNVSCFIRNPLLNQKLEAGISLADDMCPNESLRMTSIVTMVLMIIGFLILIFRNRKLKMAKDKLKDECGKLEDVCDQLEDENDKLQDEHNKLQDEHNKLKDVWSKSTAKLDKLKDECDKIKFEYDIIKYERDNLKDDYGKATAKVDKLKDECDKIKYDRDIIKYECDNLKDDYDRIKHEHYDLKGDCDIIKYERDKLQNDYDKLKTELDKNGKGCLN